MSAQRAPGRTCPACGSEDLLTVELTVGDAPISFTTCHNCESKWWEREGATVPLSEVIGRVADH